MAKIYFSDKVLLWVIHQPVTLHIVIIQHLYPGGEDHQIGYDAILEFNPGTEQWALAGHMMESRYYHAMSTINFEDVREFCIVKQSN